MERPSRDGRWPRSSVLCGLARNPAAPADVVARLLREPSAAREIARRRADISDDLAVTLLALDDPEVAANLGHNDRVPSGVRWRLARHAVAEVRACAVRNEIPEEFQPGCEVPVALLVELADDPSPKVRARVAEHLRTPPPVRERLAADPDPGVRVVLAERWNDPPEHVLRALLTDEDPGVRKRAIRPWFFRAPPADLHARLLADRVTRAEVIPHLELTDDLADELAASPDTEVRAALAARPDLPATVVDLLAARPDPDGLVTVALVTNQATSESLRARLYAEITSQHGAADFGVSYFLNNAWLDFTLMRWLREAGLSERLTYLDSPYSFFRKVLASSTDLPAWADMRLMADPDIEVRRIVARRSTAVPGHMLEQLVREHGETHWIFPYVCHNPNFPPEAFPRFADSGVSSLRQLACGYEDLPASAVATIAQDPEPLLRAAAAEHPHLPAEALNPLLDDDDPDVLEAAYAAPTLPPETMYAVLTKAGL